MNVLIIIILAILLIFINSCIKVYSRCSKIEEKDDGDNRDLED